MSCRQTPFVMVLVRWAIGKSLTNYLQQNTAWLHHYTCIIRSCVLYPGLILRTRYTVQIKAGFLLGLPFSLFCCSPIGLVWFRSVRFGSVRFGSAWLGSVLLCFIFTPKIFRCDMDMGRGGMKDGETLTNTPAEPNYPARAREPPAPQVFFTKTHRQQETMYQKLLTPESATAAAATATSIPLPYMLPTAPYPHI